MQISELVGKDIAVTCNTFEKYQRLLARLHEAGCRWENEGLTRTELDFYRNYGERTCLTVSNGYIQYCSIDYFKVEDYKILDIEDVVHGILSIHYKRNGNK